MKAECPSGKIGYTSKHAAGGSRGKRRNQGRRMRAYLCPTCHCWHLTTEAFVR